MVIVEIRSPYSPGFVVSVSCCRCLFSDVSGLSLSNLYSLLSAAIEIYTCLAQWPDNDQREISLHTLDQYVCVCVCVCVKVCHQWYWQAVYNSSLQSSLFACAKIEGQPEGNQGLLRSFLGMHITLYMCGLLESQDYVGKFQPMGLFPLQIPYSLVFPFKSFVQPVVSPKWYSASGS